MTHRTPESLFVALMMCAASCGVALAGGENVEVATSGLRVWVTGPGVVELDLGTGRVLQRLTVPAAPFPLGVTIVGDEAWVASASDRFTGGALTRFAPDGHRRTVYRNSDGFVGALSTGAGSVWALVGGRARGVSEFTRHGRLVRIRGPRNAGWLTGDDEGAWVTAGRRVVRLDSRPGAAGRSDPLALSGPISTGTGGLWAETADGLIRLDRRTLRVTRRIRFPDPLARTVPGNMTVGDHDVWLIRAPRPGPIGLVVRVSLATGTVRARRIVAGANAIHIDSRALWVTVAFPKERLLRLDPSSLKVLADYPLL